MTCDYDASAASVADQKESTKSSLEKSQSKRTKLPFGHSIVGCQFNDRATIAAAEEIEAAFGGWQQPRCDKTTHKTPISLASP